MKVIKFLGVFLIFSIFTLTVAAQDAVVIDTGNFIRGTIQGTDFQSVSIKKDDGEVQQFKAKDIKEFLWNGVTFVSKPFVTNRKNDYRFFKLVESGAVNLYTMGGNPSNEKPKHNRIRIMPSIGIGIGTGGYSGVGFGGGVSFGGGRRDDGRPKQDRRALYYIEKPGTGEILEITPDQDNSDTNMQYIKNTLLTKFADDNDLVARVKEMDSFDAKSIRSLVKTYNSVHQ